MGNQNISLDTERELLARISKGHSYAIIDAANDTKVDPNVKTKKRHQFAIIVPPKFNLISPLAKIAHTKRCKGRPRSLICITSPIGRPSRGVSREARGEIPL